MDKEALFEVIYLFNNNKELLAYYNRIILLNYSWVGMSTFQSH